MRIYKMILKNQIGLTNDNINKLVDKDMEEK